MQEICRTCSGFQPKSYCIASDRFHKELPKIYKTRPTYPETDPVVLEAAWFRQHFLGKPYVTLIEPDFGMITIVQEKKKYRIIVRSKEVRHPLLGPCSDRLFLVQSDPLSTRLDPYRTRNTASTGIQWTPSSDRSQSTFTPALWSSVS